MPKSLYAAVPSVDSILRLDEIIVLLEQYGRSLVTDGTRKVIDDIRNHIFDDPNQASHRLLERSIVDEIKQYVEVESRSSLQAVFNLTGTVLHTNLGRAVMSDEAVEAMVRVSTNSSNIEYDLVSGKRGDRDCHLEGLLCKLTGAEAATVVNNNAAAVLLVLNTLGQRKEVLVSRGELVEIGGSFRIPDIMARAGCRLVEVGTTNRTHQADFRNAVTSKTACLMKVHTSNYVVQGFTKEVTTMEMSEVALSHNLPVIEDLGSGTLIDLKKFGLPYEPMVQDAIRNGVDIVMFSGDKLLGGPQAGLILGRKDLIGKIKKNPMKRALRLDKVTIAALIATLQLYLDPDKVVARLPTLRLLSRKPDTIEDIAERVIRPLSSVLGNKVCVKKIVCQSQIGSGSLPVGRLASFAISISPLKRKSGGKLKKYSAAFRALPIPVIGRIQDDAFVLDMRCLEDVEGFIAQLGDLQV
jgi:L-seryl-tRNA(Ser) seleniumtransferase